nr:hypothetical protein CFP56_02878 [Quercus suber]
MIETTAKFSLVIYSQNSLAFLQRNSDICICQRERLADRPPGKVLGKASNSSVALSGVWRAVFSQLICGGALGDSSRSFKLTPELPLRAISPAPSMAVFSSRRGQILQGLLRAFPPFRPSPDFPLSSIDLGNPCRLS